mgnify:CR=1 FL=1
MKGGDSMNVATLKSQYGERFWQSLSDEERAWIEGTFGLPVKNRLPNDINERQRVQRSVEEKIFQEGLRKGGRA